MGKNIVKYGLIRYEWIKEVNSVYKRYNHIYDGNDFGQGIQWTNIIESKRSQL